MTSRAESTAEVAAHLVTYLAADKDAAAPDRREATLDAKEAGPSTSSSAMIATPIGSRGANEFRGGRYQKLCSDRLLNRVGGAAC